MKNKLLLLSKSIIVFAISCGSSFAQVSVSISSTNITCNGGSDATATANPSGGMPPYTYSWAPGGQTTAMVTNLVAGTYTVTVTDNMVMTGTQTITITEPLALTSSTSQVNPTCFGMANGNATGLPSGGTPPYTYSWGPTAGNQTTQVASSLAAGNYTVNITDSHSCATLASTTITQPSVTSVNPSGSPTICVGGSTSVSASPVGGTPPYTYNWLPTGGLNCTTCSNPLANPATTSTYTINVTDANGCTANANLTVTVNPQPTITVNASPSTICTGASTTIFASGGSTYVWSPGGMTTSSINVSPSTSTTYTVTGQNVMGCSNMATQTVIVNTVQTPTATSNSPVCGGKVLALTSSYIPGGATYSWTGPNAYSSSVQNPIIANAIALMAGTYTITATLNGCTSMSTVGVSISQNPIVSITKTDVTCFGAADGTATENASGGTGAYSYLWSCGSTTQSVANLIPGMATVTVTDGIGCSSVDSVYINTPTQIMITLAPTSATCGSANGNLNSSVSGGVGPYTYLWADGSTGMSLSNIPSGQYYLAVTDNNSCMVSATGNVDDAGGPSVVLNSISNISCNGGTDGAVLTTISGGAAPLDIQWMNGVITDDLTNIPAGTYDLVVTDASGCVVYRTYTVNEANPLYFSGSSVSPSACTLTDGSADIAVTGGTPPYIYMWDAVSGSQTTSTASGLGAGAYKVVFMDANGCSDSSYVSISDPSAPTINVDSTFDAGCVTNGSGVGAIYISMFGGTGPFSYMWSDGSTNEDATGLGKGIFGVTVTDAGTGCKASAAQFIYGIQPGTPQICLVTVDTATNHNIIVWEKDIPGIETYKIYRESSTPGNFNLIATIPADSLSTYEDTLANAGVKPWDYEIKVIDSCGVTSLLSLTHQSIFLTIGQGAGNTVDLSWTPYVGTPFSSYYIYRRTPANPWTLIDSTLVGITMYNDATAPSPIDSIDYLIEIEPTNPCNPSRAAINTSRSNIKNSARLTATGIKEALVETKALVFPNPAQSELNIKIDRKGKFEVQVYDVTGRQVKGLSPELSSQNLAKINIATIESGVYILKLVFDDRKVYRTKFIKQ